MSAPLPSDPGVAAFRASHRARDVFIGAFAALTAVTLLSLGLGYSLSELLPATVVPWLAAALFLGFGVKLQLDAQRMGAYEAEEQEAEQAINEAESRRRISTTWAVIWEAFTLVFIAELGDRTPFATIVLATAPTFTFAGLPAGTLAGHALVTGLGVGAGQWIGSGISETLLYRRSGGLFLVFGLFSLHQAHN